MLDTFVSEMRRSPPQAGEDLLIRHQKPYQRSIGRNLERRRLQPSLGKCRGETSAGVSGRPANCSRHGNCGGAVAGLALCCRLFQHYFVRLSVLSIAAYNVYIQILHKYGKPKRVLCFIGQAQLSDVNISPSESRAKAQQGVSTLAFMLAWTWPQQLKLQAHSDPVLQKRTSGVRWLVP